MDPMASAERAERLAELVKAAVERGPEHWDSFLDEECKSDPAMRAEIDSLLKHQKHVEQFIEPSALQLAADSFLRDGADRAGQMIEDYQILSRLGVGGMGEVYLAQDTKLRRRVALKLVRAGMDTSEIVARFRQEEHILASLNHPNIAQLYGAGVTGGDVPFLVMEYIQGVRIDDYCKTKALSTSARLELFRKVCSAVLYAHQRLIIHRDLKPSNILVTVHSESVGEQVGEPKLLDFGIAKLLEGQDAFTKLQTTVPGVMTPDYASPEQVRGEAMTTSTDVYSLGVLLYELLTGQRPYRLKTRSPDEIARAITDQEPDRPSTAIARGDGNSKFEIRDSKFLKGDIDNIVLMALRKEPSRRYASVGQFSEDIRRYLEGLPVVAHKDTFSYRAKKFIKRHKIGVAAAALVLLSLVGGIVATLWQARRATEQAKVAAQERDRAERRFNDVRRLSNALLTDIAPKIERLQGSTEARQALVVQSLEYLNSLAQEAGGDLLLQSELASAYEKVGDLQGNPRKPNLGDFAGAISSYKKANQIRRNLPDTAEQQRLLAENVRGLANIRRISYDIKGALQDYAGALKIYENLLTKNPDSHDLQTAYLKTKLELAEVYGQTTYQFDMAASLEREIIAALERLDPNKQETRLFLATAYSQLGHSLSWDNKQSEAEAEMAKATALADSLAAENPNDTNVQQGVFRVYALASLINETLNDELSLQFAHKALRIVERSIERDAADVQAKQNLAKTYARLGMIYANLKRVSEAISALEKSEKISLEILEREPMNRGYQHDLAVVYTHFGLAKYAQHDWQGALKAYQKTADYFETFMRTDEKNLAGRRDLAHALRYIGLTHRELGDKKKAKENFQRALELLNQLKDQNSLGGWDQLTVDELQSFLQSL